MTWYDPFSDPANQFTPQDLQQIANFRDWEAEAKRIADLARGNRQSDDEEPEPAVKTAVKRASKKKKVVRRPKKETPQQVRDRTGGKGAAGPAKKSGGFDAKQVAQQSE